MNQIDQQGGVSLRIVPDSNIRQSFGYAEARLGSREVALSESTARDEKGCYYRPLSIMLVELTNISRIKEFQQVNNRFLQGCSSIERAAHDTEKVEYQTTQDMNRYYREARSIIQNLDYGSPNLWYLHENGEMVYPTFEHYFRTMCESGHTDAYRNFFSMAEQHRLMRKNENAG
ncbi:hypothetical protein NC803_05940 [Brenneria sp. KBI 447]|uniref:Uncharacterized protein n=2 Tax=Brenneria izbisi TaxID=2939450 RepID=A0AA41Y2U8_9GAMM|nr:hypothetical protein [Brenneria izbisi]MCV9878386.1 hypothetical protein [Brenneria izbisi]MCV9881809.1 hypothetical protein [Brenneria izbisi]